MDWKIPATILILAFVVGLGILPIFSPDFDLQVSDNFGSFDGLFGNSTTPNPTKCDENVVFNMSVSEFPAINTKTPIVLTVESIKKYELNLDSKNMSLKGPLKMEGFIGEINLITGKISGTADKLSSDYFTMDGKTEVSLSSQSLEKITLSDLIMLDAFTVKSGTLRTSLIRGNASEMEIKINSAEGVKLYCFKGSLEYSDLAFKASGTSSMIKTTGLTIGIEQIK